MGMMVLLKNRLVGEVLVRPERASLSRLKPLPQAAPASRGIGLSRNAVMRRAGSYRA